MSKNFNPIIQQLVENALSVDQLKNLVGPDVASHTRWIVYDDLVKFKNLEELMKYKVCVILLQIEKPNAPKVGHFIVLLDHNSHYEHFDSYGLTMDEERGITNEHHLTNIFKNSRKPIVDNIVKLQRWREDINTCGRWVVTRLLLKDLELKSFLRLMNYFHTDYDQLVAIMTLLLQYKK